MNPIVRNVLAVLAGIVVGSIINMAILMVSGKIIPLPEGVNPMDGESIKSAIENGLFETKHYIFPFLAHALGTLVGAIIAGKMAANNNTKFAMGIGVWFLIGGIANTFMIPAPEWFIATDLILAYLPMGWIAGKLLKA